MAGRRCSGRKTPAALRSRRRGTPSRLGAKVGPGRPGAAPPRGRARRRRSTASSRSRLPGPPSRLDRAERDEAAVRQHRHVGERARRPLQREDALGRALPGERESPASLQGVVLDARGGKVRGGMRPVRLALRGVGPLDEGSRQVAACRLEPDATTTPEDSSATRATANPVVNAGWPEANLRTSSQAPYRYA
jgi:hypothetical protein